MTRRALLASLSLTLAQAAARLPANKNIRWGLSANLWNFYPHIPFTDILDIMRDTGFPGLRITQYPGILTRYGITPAQMQKEIDQRGLKVMSASFNHGQAHIPDQLPAYLAEARALLNFLKPFGATLLSVFSPPANARFAGTPTAFPAMCNAFNQLGALANSMGVRAGLHSHLTGIVSSPAEIDRCLSLTDPKLFYFAPDTAHVYLAGGNPAQILQKHKARLATLDYKDAWRKGLSIDVRQNLCDLGQGEIDFPACHRVLSSMHYQGWICVDLDIARATPRTSFQQSGQYIVNKLEPIYA